MQGSTRWALRDSGTARLRPSRQRPSRLSGSFALPKIRAGATELGRARLRPSLAKAFAARRELRPPKNVQRDRTREGEAPSEPAKAFAAQQELRLPTNTRSATELGRARLRPGTGKGLRGSAGASHSQKYATALAELGRARLGSGGRGSVRAGKGPLRLSRSFALPESCKGN